MHRTPYGEPPAHWGARKKLIQRKDLEGREARRGRLGLCDLLAVPVRAYDGFVA